MMHSILVVRPWYAFFLFAISIASPILVQRQDENGIPWPRGGFNVPIGSPQQSWYIFYNGTGCGLPECTAATELNNIWLSMINQMISYLNLGTLPLREPLSLHLPMPVTWRGHETAYMFGAIEPHRKNGVDRAELLIAMRNLRQQVLEHVVFRRFLADIYQGWKDLSATVVFGARLRDTRIDMNGSTISLEGSPATYPTYLRPSTNVTPAVQVDKRAPASNLSEDLPPWPIGRFNEPTGSSKDSWFNKYDATSKEPEDPRDRALWTELCDLIIQDMLESPVGLVRKSYVHEAKRPSPSQLGETESLKVLFAPRIVGIEKKHVIAAMEDIKRLIGQYCCLALLEVWMFEGKHDYRAYSCFYVSVPVKNGQSPSWRTGLPANLVEGLQNIDSDPDADPVPTVDIA